MHQTLTSPTISIIVEWENAILAGDQVAYAMLDRLSEESRSLENVSEVRFVFDPAVVDVGEFKSLVTSRIAPQRYGNKPLNVVFQAVEGLHYYEYKNAGASASTMDIVAFLDSDSLPDPGWLQDLTAPLRADSTCMASAGSTHVAPGGSYDAAFAAGWIFPLPADIRPTRYTPYFFANNVAFRRSFLIDNPFPQMSRGVTRGACASLSKKMAADNKKISFQPGARAWHPPPNGFNHFVTRALAHGRDEAYNASSANWVTRLGQIGVALGRIVVAPVRTAFRIARNRRQLNAGLLAPITGAGVMLAYATLQCAGLLIALTAPGVARHSWKI
ncbi:MAG: glycosyltransferase [Aestuariivirga sp.]